METLEQLKEIVKNAPDGATHHDSLATWKYKNLDRGTFLMPDGTGYKINDFYPNETIRSLSDIKRIIELIEAVKSLPDKLETDKWLEGLDRPTEFAISQAKSFAIGSVFDSIKKAKELL